MKRLAKDIADGVLAGLGMATRSRVGKVNAARVRARAALRPKTKEVTPCAVQTSVIPADTEEPGKGDPGDPSADAPSDRPIVDESDEFWGRVAWGADRSYVSRLVERGLLKPPPDEDDKP